MQHNMHILLIHRLQEVLRTDALAPVAACACLTHAVGEPEGHVWVWLAHSWCGVRLREGMVRLLEGTVYDLEGTRYTTP